MKIDGGCQCGDITFEAEVDPKQVGICHCSDCQAFSGSAFRVGVAAADKDFKLLSGEPRTYIKTAASGSKRAQVFCPNCGTHIYSTSAHDEKPKTYRVRVGIIRQRNDLPPAVQIWCRSALPWVRDLASIRSVETQ